MLPPPSLIFIRGKFDGRCKKCSQRIVKGHPIGRVNDSGIAAYDPWVCRHCMADVYKSFLTALMESHLVGVATCGFTVTSLDKRGLGPRFLLATMDYPMEAINLISITQSKTTSGVFLA